MRFDADYSIASGAVGSLWLGVDLPASLVAGTYRGTLSLTARSGGVGNGNGIEGGGGGGGGGGRNGSTPFVGANGGSGVVVIRYLT